MTVRSKLFYPLLALEGAGCAALAVWYSGRPAAGWLPALLAFPLEPLGAGLRALSLRGGAANAAAWALYFAVCLLPLGGALAQRRRGRWGRESWLLVLLSALLFPLLYAMVNPGLLGRWFPSPVDPAWAGAVCGSAVWCCLVTWALLRLVRVLPARSTAALQQGLQLALAGLDVLLVAQVCGIDLAALLGRLAQLAQSNTALSARQLAPTRIFLCLHFLAEALPCVFVLAATHQARALLDAARTGRYSEATLAAAGRLARLCGRLVTAALLTWLAFALAQLAFAPVLYQLDSVLYLPLDGVILLLAALIWARWMAEGKALKDENEGFI